MLHIHRRQKVVFMYAERYRYSGSTIMRGYQLSQIVKRFYGKQLKITYSPLSLRHHDAIIILTKGAVTSATADQIASLTEKGNRVLLDPVDDPLDPEKAKRATGIIAASMEAFDAYSNDGYRSYIVNHHVDTRLPRQPRTFESVLCGYFGELVNTVTTDHIAAMVDFIQVETSRQSDEWLEKPQQYNLHYAVRADNVTAFKPFLKGFTAAACHANIVIQRDQKEAVRWLGEDYPYLLPAHPTEQNIIELLTHIKQTFGSDEWKRGIQIIEEIREKTSDKSIADEFMAVMKDILHT